MPGRTRIGPRRPRRIFLAEWRESRGLSQKSLGLRLDPPVTDVTISRWERAARGERVGQVAQMNDDVKAALAEALDIEPWELYRHPDQPSADALLRGETDEFRREVIAQIEFMKSRRSASK